MKIRAKISLGMIGLYLATALATAVGVITVTYGTVNEQNRETLKAITESLEDDYNHFLASNREILGGYADTDAFIAVARGGHGEAVEARARKVMTDVRERSPQVADVFISLGSRIILSDQGFLPAAPEGETEFHQGPDGKIHIVVQRALGGSAGRLGFVLSMEFFTRRVAKMRIAPRAELLIIDKDHGRLLMHTDPTHIVSPSQGLREFIARPEKATEGLHRFTVGKDEKAAYLLLEGDLIFGVTLYTSDLFLGLYRTYWLLVLIAAAAAIAFVILALLLARSISLPVTRLSEAARQIAARNYKVRVSLGSGDEMELLGRAFNAMAEDIQSFTEKLEELVARRTRELEEKVRLIEELSVTDALTGLFNRKRFEEELDAEIVRARRYRTSFAVIMFDIDHFKSINDGHGHAVGDSVLVELAALSRRSIRATDLLSRWGGEEFMVLLPQTDLGGAASMAEKLRHVVDTASFTGVARVTCSFGVTAFTEIDDAPVILKRADDALYEAKETGRNRVVVG